MDHPATAARATVPTVRRLLLPTCLACLLALVAAGPASAQDVYEDFRGDGEVDPCKYTDEQLQNALDNLPPDIVQYAPGFADQLAAGREGCGGAAPGSNDTRDFEAVPAPGAAASGSGGGGGGGGAEGAGGASGRSADADGAGGAAARNADVVAPPSPTAGDRVRLAGATPAVSATPGTSLPGWVIVLLIVVAVVAALIALARRRGIDLAGPTAPLRAAFREAAGRTADAAATALDRVPLRR